MRSARCIAIASLGAALAIAGHAAVRADGAACEAEPIVAARKVAQARRDAGDPSGAWRHLEPFVGLACPDDAGTPKDAARSVLADFGWLLNDAYVNGADPRLGPDAPAANDACIELLRPLADDDLRPHPWMSAALRKATAANIKACAARCVSAACAPFRATVWATYRSEERRFSTKACTDRGQQLDAGRCLDIRPGNAGFGFAWRDFIKGDAATPDDVRAFCPALYLHAPGRKDAVRLELPETSALRDDSTCCARFDLKVKPGTDQFMIVGPGSRDCYGGTAQRMVEEIYRLPPGAERPALLRDNSEGVH